MNVPTYPIIFNYPGIFPIIFNYPGILPIICKYPGILPIICTGKYPGISFFKLHDASLKLPYPS